MVFGLGRVFAGEFGAAGFLCGLELHVFDAGQIWIEEVELNLAVAAHLGLGAVGAFAVVGGELCDGVFHVDDAEGEVVHDAYVLECGVGWVVEHVLDPVGAVGDLKANPVDGVGFGAAVPVGAEA